MLAGDSILHVAKFLKKYMPQVMNYLKVDRFFEASTIRKTVQLWQHHAFQARPSFQKRYEAMHDLKETIEEMKHYRAAVFRKNE